MNRAREVGRLLEAEEAWEKALARIEECFIPGQGWKGRQIVDERIRRSLKAVGGIADVYAASDQERLFRKKDFVAFYVRTYEVEELAPLLPAREIRQFLEERPERKAEPLESWPMPAAAIVEKMGEGFPWPPIKVGREPVVPLETAEQIKERDRIKRARLREHVEKHYPEQLPAYLEYLRQFDE